MENQNFNPLPENPLNNANTSPVGSGMPTTSSEKGIGAIIGVIIVLAVLIAGGIYFFMSKKVAIDESQTPTDSQSNSTLSTGSAIEASDELTQIEAELQGTDLGGLEMDLSAAEKEF